MLNNIVLSVPCKTLVIDMLSCSDLFEQIIVDIYIKKTSNIFGFPCLARFDRVTQRTPYNQEVSLSEIRTQGPHSSFTRNKLANPLYNHI